MREIFKDITGYEGLYQVSNLGRVKSLKFGNERILSPGTQRGYLSVILYKNGKVKNYFVHRLVATAFLKNPDTLPQVNHIDQNKQNNIISNLEWCSRKYNIRYSKARKVGCYKDRNLIKVYDSTIDVDKDGFNHSNVVQCCKGKLKSSGGYQWNYLE